MEGYYKVGVPVFKEKNYSLWYKHAFALYSSFLKKTKRKPYIRSKYFRKEKVFLDLFWRHLHQKNWRDRKRRLIFYGCALDLIANTSVPPVIQDNPNNRQERLYKCYGISKNKRVFAVHIKEYKKTGEKYFMSVFP